MEFDRTTTAGVYVAVVALATAALVAAPMMTTRTVLTMVLPSMLVYGGLMLLIGVKHGEHRVERDG